MVSQLWFDTRISEHTEGCRQNSGPTPRRRLVEIIQVLTGSLSTVRTIYLLVNRPLIIMLSPEAIDVCQKASWSSVHRGVCVCVCACVRACVYVLWLALGWCQSLQWDQWGDNTGKSIIRTTNVTDCSEKHVSLSGKEFRKANNEDNLKPNRENC